LLFLQFFSLLLRGPPRTTLFPYTTLFRSSEASLRATSRRRPYSTPDGQTVSQARQPRQRSRWVRKAAEPASSRPSATARIRWRRSEEHTSELQSRENLVCRLLLEKKKK